MVCSLFADQPFWGKQMERLGAGAHVGFAKLDAAKLDRAVRQLLRPVVVERARRLADAMCSESNAVARAADLIEARTNRSTAQTLA